MIEPSLPLRVGLSVRARLSARAITLRLQLAPLLRRRSLPDLLSSLTPDRAMKAPAPLPLVEQALRDVEALFERLRVVPDTCLYRGLARYAVLRGAGHPACFVMGVKPPATLEIAGHAWVELHGAPAFEAVDPSLVVTFAYPDRAQAILDRAQASAHPLL
jgi:hypothetical protein